MPAPDRQTSQPGAGWAWLWRDPYVRPMTLYLAVNNLAVQAFQTPLLLFVLGPLGLPAAGVGVAATGIGPRLVIALAAGVSAVAALIPACSAVRSLKGLPTT